MTESEAVAHVREVYAGHLASAAVRQAVPGPWVPVKREAIEAILRPLGVVESEAKREEISSGIAYRRAKMQAPDGTLNPALRESTAGVGLAEQVGSLPTADSTLAGGDGTGKPSLGVVANPSVAAPSPVPSRYDLSPPTDTADEYADNDWQSLLESDR